MEDDIYMCDSPGTLFTETHEQTEEQIMDTVLHGFGRAPRKRTHEQFS